MIPHSTEEFEKDGWIEYHFPTERKVRLEVDEETGGVDHHELGLVDTCVEGQLLATLRPPQDGTPGVSVYGDFLPPKQGKVGRLIPGRNTFLSNCGNELYASIQGHVSLSGDRVVVSPVFLVTGSVGPETGNIRFPGCVEVQGGVEDGYRIQATGRVVVGKTVGNARIDSDGDIEIRGGMAGRGTGELHAGGDIRIRFLQEAVAVARGSIYVSESVMHSRLESDGRIFVGVGQADSRKGVVVGGQLQAFQAVNCRTLGALTSTNTNVEVGLQPMILRRWQELIVALKKEKETLAKVRKGIHSLEALSAKLGSLPLEKGQMLRTLVGTQESLQDQIVRFLKELQELETRGMAEIHGEVSVAAKAYPGVRIQIGSSSRFLVEPFVFTTFFEESERIKTRPYQVSS